MIIEFAKYAHQMSGYVAPKVGDYVLCQMYGNENYFYSRIGYHRNNIKEYQKDVNDFLDNNIGQIVEMTGYKGVPFRIKYLSTPDYVSDIFVDKEFIVTTRKGIKFYDKDIENLETKIDANKYNL